MSRRWCEVRILASLVMGGCVAVLGGCLPGSSPLAARVEVRDARTGEPVPMAEVRTTGGNVFIPPRDVLGPPVSPWANPSGGRRETQADGGAEIVLAGNRPNELTVIAEGFAPLHLTLQAGASSVSGATDWSLGRLPPLNAAASPPQRLEVRVRAQTDSAQ